MAKKPAPRLHHVPIRFAAVVRKLGQCKAMEAVWSSSRWTGSDENLRAFLRGRTTIHEGGLVVLAIAAGVSVDWLLGRDDFAGVALPVEPLNLTLLTAAIDAADLVIAERGPGPSKDRAAVIARIYKAYLGELPALPDDAPLPAPPQEVPHD